MLSTGMAANILYLPNHTRHIHMPCGLHATVLLTCILPLPLFLSPSLLLPRPLPFYIAHARTRACFACHTHHVPASFTATFHLPCLLHTCPRLPPPLIDSLLLLPLVSILLSPLLHFGTLLNMRQAWQ